MRTLIDGSRFLSALPPEAAEALVAAARERTLRPGEYSARQGDPAFGLAWLQSGLVFVFFEMSDGSRAPYLVAWPHSVSLEGVLEVTTFPCSSIALTPATFFWMPRAEAVRTSREHPGLMDSLFRYGVRMAERRAVWLGHLFSLPLRGRVRMILARMALEMAHAGPDGHALDYPVSHRALAVVAQVSRDEVGRAVRELLAEGIIKRIPGRRLLVPDPRRLLGPSLLESAVGMGVIPEIE